MAIDDNTLYGLTGAQVKELPERIEAVKGLAKELTAADYNANSSNWSDTDPTHFNCVALWKKEPGLYRKTDSNVKVYIRSNTQADTSIYMVGVSGSFGTPIFKFYYDLHTSGGYVIDVYAVTSASGSGSLKARICATENNLTSTSTEAPLSANQGRVLNERIGDLTTLETTAKTSAVAAINELDSDLAGKQDTLTAGSNITIADESGDLVISATDTTYTAGTGINISNGVISATSTGPTVVQTAGTSTTDVMSQNAVTSMVYADPSTRNNIKIGHNTSAGGYYSVALGYQARAQGNNNIAIGRDANVDSLATNAVAIGEYSLATAKGQFDISALGNISSTEGYNNSAYRLLTGLYDPQNAHDAATKGYVDTAVGAKQDVLTAGDNITIAEESGALVISATGGSGADVFTTNEWNALWA